MGGTQRVWMSSVMLLGKSHCGVQQLLPIDSFESLTVLHLPNKNYRRVGKQGRLGGAQNKDAPPNEFRDGTEKFAALDPNLITELEFHIALRKKYPMEESKGNEYNGIIMIDEVNKGVRNHLKPDPDFLEKLEENMDQYDEYVSRGGVLINKDMPSFFLHDYLDLSLPEPQLLHKKMRNKKKISHGKEKTE